MDDEIEEIDLDGDLESIFFPKDETFWLETPFIHTRRRLSNVILVPQGVSSHIDKQGDFLNFFNLFISPEIVDIVVNNRNQTDLSWEKWDARDERVVLASVEILDQRYRITTDNFSRLWS
ncbi:hypothetical protein HHI36_004882 [Cryptolaemus montrouzieri]|uniref:Uncharacterized protein n=1 Tax=Cryptolaemus montrouzieri TaxID=559131 RepID=A0ABD2NSH9_9CUCU